MIFSTENSTYSLKVVGRTIAVRKISANSGAIVPGEVITGDNFVLTLDKSFELFMDGRRILTTSYVTGINSEVSF